VKILHIQEKHLDPGHCGCNFQLTENGASSLKNETGLKIHQQQMI